MERKPNPLTHNNEDLGPELTHNVNKSEYPNERYLRYWFEHNWHPDNEDGWRDWLKQHPEYIQEYEFWKHMEKHHHHHDGHNDPKYWQRAPRIFKDQEGQAVWLDDDSPRAKRFEMKPVNTDLKMPQLPVLAKADQNFILNFWKNLEDDNVFDRTNANWEMIQNNTENLIKNQDNLIDWATQVEAWSQTLSEIVEDLVELKTTAVLQDLIDRYKAHLQEFADYQQQVRIKFDAMNKSITDLQNQVQNLQLQASTNKNAANNGFPGYIQPNN